jgi:hypothetical protein
VSCSECGRQPFAEEVFSWFMGVAGPETGFMRCPDCGPGEGTYKRLGVTTPEDHRAAARAFRERAAALRGEVEE